MKMKRKNEKKNVHIPHNPLRINTDRTMRHGGNMALDVYPARARFVAADADAGGGEVAGVGVGLFFQGQRRSENREGGDRQGRGGGKGRIRRRLRAAVDIVVLSSRERCHSGRRDSQSMSQSYG